MGPHVHLEITSIGGRVVALITIEKLFSRVSELVSLKGTRLCTGESTLCATKRFFPCMSPHVALESRSSFARVVALCAIESFLS